MPSISEQGTQIVYAVPAGSGAELNALLAILHDRLCTVEEHCSLTREIQEHDHRWADTRALIDELRRDLAAASERITVLEAAAVPAVPAAVPAAAAAATPRRSARLAGVAVYYGPYY